jgi:23S rRNA pseudouridine2605 synthase
VKGIPTDERLDKLRRGVNIEGVRTAPAEARLVAVREKNSLVELVLREGRNRQVKRMFLEIGHPVIRLHRPAYAFLTLDGLEPGQWRFLGLDEVKRLRAAAARAGEASAAGEGEFQHRIKKPLKAPRAGGDFRPRPASARPAREGGDARPPRPANTKREPGPAPKRTGPSPTRPSGDSRGPRAGASGFKRSKPSAPAKRRQR